MVIIKKTFIILAFFAILGLSISLFIQNEPLTIKNHIQHSQQSNISKIVQTKSNKKTKSLSKPRKKRALSFLQAPEPSALLLFGVDYITKGEKHGRSDTIILVLTSPPTKEIAMISIPRDTYIDIPGHGYNKMNTAFQLGGPELTKQTIANWLNISIDNTITIDYEAFKKLINLLGGLEIEVDKTMRNSEFTLEEGKRLLTGEEVLHFVRFRKSVDGNHDSDYQRMQRQHLVLSKLTDEVFRVRSLPEMISLVHTMNDSIDTTLSLKETLLFTKYYYDFSSDQLHTSMFQGYGKKKEGRWYEIISEEELYKKKQFINDFLSKTAEAENEENKAKDDKIIK